MPSSTDLHSQRIKAHQKDVRAVIARDFSASRMNTTKWRELAECLDDLPVLLTVKFADDDEVYPLHGFWHA